MKYFSEMPATDREKFKAMEKIQELVGLIEELNTEELEELGIWRPKFRALATERYFEIQASLLGGA